jgi:hypothetical protein
MIAESPTLFLSMSYQDYEKAEGMRKSSLDLIYRSPAHYRHESLFPSDPTPAMEWGTKFHSYVLEPDTFFDTYAVLPEGIDRRTKEGKETWANWMLENEGKVPVEKPTIAELQAMREAIFNHSRASKLLSYPDGIAESVMFWNCLDIRCKARPDMILPDQHILIDLKTTTDARPEAFSRSCWNYRYHVQAAFYCDGYRALTGHQPEAFLFIAIEKTAPYAIQVYHANEDMIERGRRDYQQDLMAYAQCLAQDRWPAYPEEILSIVLPRWTQEAA